MNLFALLLMFFSVFFGGCAAQQSQHAGSAAANADVPGSAAAVVSGSIAESGVAIQKLLVELHEAERQQPKLTDEVRHQLAYAASIDWDGDVESAVKGLADAAGIGFRVIGRPLSPVFVSLHVKDMMLVEIFRVIGMQAGHRADVVYRPSENLIEVVYAPQ